MGHKGSKNIFYQILFAICISVLYLDIYELSFAVWSVAILLTLSTSYSLNIIHYLLYFIAIFTIGFTVMLFYDYPAYYIIRDMTYMLKPIMGLLIGYQFCKRNYKTAFQTLIYTGVFIALTHLGKIAFAILFEGVRNLNGIRMQSGFFSDYEIYALIILIFHKKFELGFSKKNVFIYSLLIGLSAFMYFARTNFIQFVILFIGMKGYFSINRTSVIILASVIGFTLVGYSTILYINPKRNGPGIETLLYKIKIAPREAFKTKIDVDDWRDFNDNYRSYENIRTVKQVTSHGTVTTIFGEGFGSRIDLKKKIWLRDFLRYISILHNGFMTVFLKSGLLGIVIYLSSIFVLFRQRKSNIPIVKAINLLLVSTGIFLIFSNWVFSGLYNLLDNKSVLIAILICYKEITIRNHSDATQTVTEVQ